MASNLPLLEDAAAKLRHLLPEVVFVGGSTLDLMVTDPASAPIRSTYDVDVIVAADYADYSMFCDRLRDIGFANDTSPDAPTCRFLQGDLKLDVMSTHKEVLGFSNRWYEGAIQTAKLASLPSGKRIRLITAPFFLGTKMEAFYGRGKNDYYMSHDLEDFVAVVEGREQLLEELAEAPIGLRKYLREATGKLLGNERFLEALPGYSGRPDQPTQGPDPYRATPDHGQALTEKWVLPIRSQVPIYSFTTSTPTQEAIP